MGDFFSCTKSWNGIFLWNSQPSLWIGWMFPEMIIETNGCFYTYLPIVCFLLSDPGHEVWCLDPLTGNTGPKWRSMTLSLPGLTSPRPSLPRCVYLQVWVWLSQKWKLAAVPAWTKCVHLHGLVGRNASPLRPDNTVSTQEKIDSANHCLSSGRGWYLKNLANFIMTQLLSQYFSHPADST